MAMANTPNINPRRKKSLQITCITINGRQAKGTPSVKIIVNSETKLKRSFNEGGSKLTWDLKPAFLLQEKSRLTIQYSQAALWSKKKILSEASISFDEALGLLSSTSETCKNHKISNNPEITIDFNSGNGSHSNMLGAAIEVLSEQKPLLSRLGKSRKFLETLLSLGTAISEVEHTAKAVLGCVNVVYKRLEEQELRNKLLLDIVEGMACTLGFVEDVEQFARMAGLKKAIEEVQPLVEDTTSFILKYSSYSELEHISNAFLSSSDQQQISALKDRFESFKQRFDRGVSVQSASTIELILGLIKSNQDDILLAKLKPMDLECGSHVTECMEGTREDILTAIKEWAVDYNAPNIFWLHGHPGVGKSAIATSIVEELGTLMRLGSSFFFQRERATTLNPNALWRVVAYDLARQYPIIRKHVLSALNANENIQSTINIDKLFRHLIQEPLEEGEDIPIGRFPIVVVDALDECGGLEGQYSDHRANLMRTLHAWSKVPQRFKLIVTSRGESDIEELFSRTSHQPLEVLAGTTVNSRSLDDVRKFLESRFRLIVTRYRGALPSDWPGPHTIDELNNKGGGLFIWAKTIMDFLNRGEPREQLARILEGTGAGGMSTLYSWILNASFPNPSESVVKSFHTIVGAVILAKDPLTAKSIQSLCSIDPSTMKYICNGLQSVMELGNIPRFKHQSFVDFILHRAHCPSIFRIDAQLQQRYITLDCLRAMNRHLRFNICELESSFIWNDEVPDLTSRIEAFIPSHVMYSSCFWANHLADITFDIEIFGCVQTFMQNQFLFWLEILSITKRVNIGSRMIEVLINWLLTGEQENKMAIDMKKFMIVFGGVISQSLPHIYLSALPLSPRNSAVSKRYMGFYPQTITVESGGHADWPALQHVLNGHQGYVICVAFSHNGQRIASGSDDATIRIWDAETGEEVAGPFQTHADCVEYITFLPDGKRIASFSSRQTIEIWNIETEEIAMLSTKNHTFPARSVVFSSDGRRAACYSLDKILRIWDIETCEMIRELQTGVKKVTSITFAPIGQRIIFGCSDATIWMWDAETGLVHAGPFVGHTDCITSLAFSPDGKFIVSASNDTTIRLWNVETGFVRLFDGHIGKDTSVSFSPDCKRVLFSEDSTIRIWNVETGEVAGRSFEGHTASINAVAFSPDGRRVVSGSNDESAMVWDVSTNDIAVGPFEGHNKVITTVAFSSNGKSIVSGSRDKSIRLWDAETGMMVAGPINGHTDEVMSVSFSPDGSIIVSGSDDTTVRMWNAETGQVVTQPFKGHTGPVIFVAFSPDGRSIISGSTDNTIRIWTEARCKVIVEPFKEIKYWFISVALSPDGKCIALGGTDSIILLDVETERVIAGPFKGHTDFIMSLAFSPDGKRVASGSRDTTIRVWNTETGDMAAGPIEGHTDEVTSIAFSNDGKYIVSGSWDETVRMWNAETGVLAAEPFEGHTGDITTIAISPNGKYIASSSWDETIRVWGVFSPAPKFPFLTQNSEIVDGWILDPNGRPLFWIPPTLRAGLWRPGNVAVIGRLVTKLGFEHFVHGEDWTRCKDPVDRMEIDA